MFRVQGLGCRVQDLGFRIWGVGSSVNVEASREWFPIWRFFHGGL